MKCWIDEKLVPVQLTVLLNQQGSLVLVLHLRQYNRANLTSKNQFMQHIQQQLLQLPFSFRERFIFMLE